MKDTHKSLGLNALLNGFQSMLNLIFPIITFPYVSRILSVNGMGIYNFSNTYINYFLLVAGLGINTYAVREGSKLRDNFQKISNFSSQIFSINIISTLLAYMLLIVTLVLFERLKPYALCISIFSLQIIFTTIGANWVYIIYEDYAYITLRNIIFKVLSIILLFILVKGPNDYIVYAAITVFASVGSNILNFFHVKTFITLKITNHLNLNYHLKPILIIFASVMGVTLYASCNNTILGLIKGDYAVGIYSVALKIYTISQSLLSAILTVTIPRLSMLYGKKLFDDYGNLLSKLINLLIVLSLPAAVGLAMLSKNVVLIIAGEKYFSAANSLAIISWAIIFSLYSWVFSDCVLLPAKRENKLLINTIITAVFNILVNLLLIPFWSYNAAAVSTVLSEILVMILNGYSGLDILREYGNGKIIFKNLAEALVGCIAVVVVCYISNLITTSLIIGLCIAVPLSILFYLLILILLRNASILELLKPILRKNGWY
ncbi:Membrane protein involved in the export of O-antigen, teichoic acid lipoteichoic acids [Limosilactobacillus reuteri]|uniref:Membrane protein involved in the export of O-antigen, teichoic acid lipoteichoic acids n=1 Tax=Limosilactobacillus reuteri TaxID=1598 RepID=A0A0U5K4T1_LIMRT|nr:Membrane protein involved in the export of O-antigen, teichoic acid lipoteichoic acids [Limosilactobacillus reuteri]